MYTEAIIKSHIDKAWQLSRQIGIGDRVNLGAKYDAIGASQARTMTYIDEYMKYVDGSHWNIMLADRSLIQFKHEPANPRGYLSYVYFENPFEAPTRAEFIKLRGYNAGLEVLLADEIDREYEDYVASPDHPKANVTPIRYDYGPALYTAGRHPASHVHFGHRSQVRVATGRLWRPTSFLCFIARQCYPEQWSEFLKRSNGASEHCKQVHAALEAVPDKWDAKDFFEVGLELPRHLRPKSTALPGGSKGKVRPGRA